MQLCQTALVQKSDREGTLSTICENVKSAEVVPPAVIVVGETAKFDFAPTITRPLKNVSVTVTGTRKLSDKLGKMLTLSGAEVKRHDLLKVIEYHDNEAFDNAINGIDGLRLCGAYKYERCRNFYEPTA